ncbi:MAG TPA: M20/M25/M40 family metallo-hydrolase, partial [Sediminibacterium sp.]|nr:M20/M25/M40 family metallo-hydrolase [Sediminibacterium sp.]
FLFLPVFLSAQQEDSVMIKKISDEILRNGKAYDLLHQLTKQIGGRLAGSPQFARAVVWGEQTLKDMGADKVWLQECMVPHWVRGGQDKAMVVTEDRKRINQPLDVTALGNSLGSGTVTAPLLAVADFSELEQKKDEVKGKIVYYDKGFDPTNLQPFISYSETGIYRYAGPSRAAKYGAVGVMIRSLTESVANDPHTGSMHYDDAYPKIPAVALGPRDADKLWQMSRGNSLVVSMTTHGHFLPDTIGHNVIGELVGSEFPDQYITVGGHLDSWDVNEGATDDGAGIVHTIEIMRALKAIGYHPKHTIRFVLFANEENGLRGGTKYAAEAKAKGEKHIFAFESDAGGWTPRGFSLKVTPAQYAHFHQWLPLLVPYGVYEMSKDGGGADVSPLNQELGIPVGELNPDQQRYFDVHHARSDTFEKINKRELLLGAINMAALIYLVDKYGTE